METPTVLLAMDFSDSSELALRCALAQTQALNGKLLIAYVLPIRIADGEGMLHAGVDAEDRSAVEERLQQITPPGFDGPVEHLLLEGDPAEVLVRLSEERQVELIVMGTHGRTGLARLLMGSVAEQVVRRAPCPVLVVKNPGVG